MNLLRSFKSQPRLREKGCILNSFIAERDYARQITPQRCVRGRESIGPPLPHATTLGSSSSESRDNEVMIELAERARILISRESLTSPTYNSLNPEELQCREKMMDWCLRVLDFGTSRDVSAKGGVEQRPSLESIYVTAVAFS